MGLKSTDAPRERIACVVDVRRLPYGVGRLAAVVGVDASLMQVAWSPDGGMLATSGLYAVGIFDFESGRELHAITSRAGRQTTGAWDADGTLLATGSCDGIVKVWRVGSWKLLHTFDLESCTDLAFGPD